MKLYEIVPGHIYTRGDLRPSHAPSVREGGYTVVCLTPRPNREVERLVPTYIHFPLPDGKVKPALFETAATMVANLAKAGHRVIVHCHAGRNRAAFVAALAGLKLGRWKTGTEALESVRYVRPNAIANPHFERYLRNLKAGDVR